jgi:hypothetical protein
LSKSPTRYLQSREFLTRMSQIDPFDTDGIVSLQEDIRAYLARADHKLRLSKGREVAVTRRREIAKERDSELLPVILDLRKEGKSLREVADILTGKGIPAPRGISWNFMTVQKMLKRNGHD